MVELQGWLRKTAGMVMLLAEEVLALFVPTAWKKRCPEVGIRVRKGKSVTCATPYIIVYAFQT